MSPQSAYVSLALVCFGGTALLGAYVGTRLPTAIDRAGVRLAGVGTIAAAAFTLLGRWYAVVALAAIAAGTAAAFRRPVLPIVALLGSQVLAQSAVSAIKTVVGRERPARWLLRLEADSSFPSGHAATSIVFFLGLIAVDGRYLAGEAGTVVRAALCVCAIGIPWSRVALGAHYVTDVVGGLAFGAGWLFATLALFTWTGLLPTA